MLSGEAKGCGTNRTTNFFWWHDKYMIAVRISCILEAKIN